MNSRTLVRGGLVGFALLNAFYFVAHLVDTLRYLVGGEPTEVADATLEVRDSEALGPATWLAQAIAALSFTCLAIATLGLARRRTR